jgi:hypothetical protein
MHHPATVHAARERAHQRRVVDQHVDGAEAVERRAREGVDRARWSAQGVRTLMRRSCSTSSPPRPQSLRAPTTGRGCVPDDQALTARDAAERKRRVRWAENERQKRDTIQLFSCFW